jgi:hypothetical protein
MSSEVPFRHRLRKVVMYIHAPTVTELHLVVGGKQSAPRPQSSVRKGATLQDRLQTVVPRLYRLRLKLVVPLHLYRLLLRLLVLHLDQLRLQLVVE